MVMEPLPSDIEMETEFGALVDELTGYVLGRSYDELHGLLSAGYDQSYTFGVDTTFLPKKIPTEYREAATELGNRMDLLVDRLGEETVFRQTILHWLEPREILVSGEFVKEDTIDTYATPQIIADNIDNYRDANHLVSLAAFNRAHIIEQAVWRGGIHLEDQGKVDMPVGALASSVEGLALTPPRLSIDNRVGDPSWHAEHLTAADMQEVKRTVFEAVDKLIAQYGLDIVVNPDKYFPNMVMQMTQPHCRGCWGFTYYYQPGGLVVGSFVTGDVPMVHDKYKEGKLTSIELAIMCALVNARNYMDRFILDLGKTGVQIASHMTASRIPKNNGLFYGYWKPEQAIDEYFRQLEHEQS